VYGYRASWVCVSTYAWPTRCRRFAFDGVFFDRGCDRRISAISSLSHTCTPSQIVFKASRFALGAERSGWSVRRTARMVRQVLMQLGYRGSVVSRMALFGRSSLPRIANEC
jgi:hypothetical protein